MKQLLLFLALISTNQLAKSASQSFSSSSIVKPNGQVVSSSIYTDSKGNHVVNGQSLRIPPLPNDLLPPFAPGELVKPIFAQFQPIQPLLPVNPAVKPSVIPAFKPVVIKPAGVQTTVKTTTTRTTTTVRPTTRPTTRPITRASAFVNRVPSGTKNSSFDDKGRYIENSPGTYVHDPTVGAYVHDPSAGAYVHDPSIGAWKPDDRGKYKKSK